PLLFVSIDVFRIDDVVGLSTARRTGATAVTGRTGLAASLRPGLVHRFSQLIGSLGQCIPCAVGGRNGAAFESLLAVGNRGFNGLHIGFRKFVAIFTQHLFGLIHQRIRTVSRFNLLLFAFVLVGMGLRFTDHLIDVVFGQTA